MNKQQPLPLDQRQAILQREINGYLSRGFRVQSQTETTAQLVKPKRFSLLWAVLWFFVFGVGLLLYLLYYLSKKDETVYLEVGEAGQVKRIGAGGLSGGGLRLFGLSSTGTLILCGGCLALSVILTLVNSGNEPTQTQAVTAIAAATDAAPTKKPSTPVLPTATLEPTAGSAGLTTWLIEGSQQVGVREIAWSRSTGGYRAESGKIFVSLYIVGVNIGDKETTFNPLDFSLVDGGGEVNGQLFIEPKEPKFSLCTIRPGGICEGWWTTSIWDRPEVKENLIFKWQPSLFGPSQETPLEQP